MMGKLFFSKKFWYFLGGVAVPTLGKKMVKHPKTREVAVNTLAKGLKFKQDAVETFVNMKEEAEDICYDAQKQIETTEE